MSRSLMPTALTKVAALALPPYIQTERPVSRKRSSSARLSSASASSVAGRRLRSASLRIAFSRAIVAATIERTGRVPGGAPKNTIEPPWMSVGIRSISSSPFSANSRCTLQAV